LRAGSSPALPWLHKYLGNPALTAILNSFSMPKIGDAYCGMRITKRVYERVDPEHQDGFALELVIKAGVGDQGHRNSGHAVA
jgi:hypothetical protein